MKEHAFRLKKNDDLKKAIQEYCINNNIDTACVLSSVGSLSRLNIRLASALESKEIIAPLEIVSLNGTISKGEAHIHISVSDELGNCFGGHLKENSLIETTAEIILGELEEYKSVRKMDEETHFKEIEFFK